MSLFGTIAGAAINAGIGALSNAQSHYYTTQNMYNSYELNEQAAQNADVRQRAQYRDLYSPQALLEQYKAAGLSPSMMFGGTPGQGSAGGAQGGVGTPSTPYAPISLLEGAQIAAIQAQTEKTKAETANINVDTVRQEIQQGIEQLAAQQYNTEWQILNSTWKDHETGKETSIFEAAREHFSYSSFLEWCRGEHVDEVIKEATKTEAGQKILRSIYIGASQFSKDIQTLSTETINAGFQRDILTALKEKDYANMNANAAVQELKTSIATNELTESQKEAWNNLLDRLGKKGSTGRDIAIILGMILNNFGNKIGIKINTGN